MIHSALKGWTMDALYFRVSTDRKTGSSLVAEAPGDQGGGK